ncbi:MAG: MoaD family protein [Candidatus Geothermarchaeales archaeon]
MAEVTVKVFASLRERMGWKERKVNTEGTRIVDVLKGVPGGEGTLYVTLMDPNGRHLTSRYNIMLNSRNVTSLKGLKTKVRDGDRILVFPPVGGG